MLEQHGRSYPIIPGDAAKHWTVCDPAQICFKNESGQKRILFLDMGALLDFFFLFIFYLLLIFVRI